MPCIAQLTRLVVRQSPGAISRSEGGILSSLSAGPRRITDLAELEGLAQPTATLLIKRMEQSGWVARRRDDQDRRVVLVSLTPAGASALAQFRAQYRDLLRGRLATLPAAQVAVLGEALGALDALIAALQPGDQR